MAWRDQATIHYLNQGWLDYRRIYVSLGLNELIKHCWFIVNSIIEQIFELHSFVTKLPFLHAFINATWKVQTIK